MAITSENRAKQAPVITNVSTHTFYAPGDSLPEGFPTELVGVDGLPTIAICAVCGAGGPELELFTCEQYVKFTASHKEQIRINIRNALYERLHHMIDIAVRIAATGNHILHKGFTAAHTGVDDCYGDLLEMEVSRLQILWTVMDLNHDVNWDRINGYNFASAEEFNSEMQFNCFPMEILQEQPQVADIAVEEDILY